MSEYKVYITPSVERKLRKLSRKIHDRIIKQILLLKENPRPIGIKKLTDQEGYRIRIGDFRVLYTINDKESIVEVFKVGDRKDIYR